MTQSTQITSCFVLLPFLWIPLTMFDGADDSAPPWTAAGEPLHWKGRPNCLR